MIGVVLWSDATDRKAVFWCEDQGDLAYYETPVADIGGFFEAGDMVQFEVRMDRKLRKALNARLIQQQACHGLPQKLRAAANEPQVAAPRTAQIIAFSGNDQRHAEMPHRAALEA